VTRSSSKSKLAALLNEVQRLDDEGDYDNALKTLDQVLCLAPDHRNLTRWIALKSRFLLDLDRRGEAKSQARQAIKLYNAKLKDGEAIDEWVHLAWHVLGIAYLDEERFVRAAICFEKRLEFGYEDYSIYTMLAAAQSQFNPESAIKNAELALKLNPDWDEAKSVLATAKENLLRNKSP